MFRRAKIFQTGDCFLNVLANVSFQDFSNLVNHLNLLFPVSSLVLVRAHLLAEEMRDSRVQILSGGHFCELTLDSVQRCADFLLSPIRPYLELLQGHHADFRSTKVGQILGVGDFPSLMIRL